MGRYAEKRRKERVTGEWGCSQSEKRAFFNQDVRIRAGCKIGAGWALSAGRNDRPLPRMCTFAK